MLNVLKALIADSQEQKLESGVLRDLQIEPVSGKASVCIGVRRCGKSTLHTQMMERLLAKGVSRRNIVSINFFDDRLRVLEHDGLDLILTAYYSMYPEKKNEEKVYFFFDEIQMVPNWEAFVERILRTEQCEVFISGSSAQMLSKEIASQMRGRALSWELFPFSFCEFLRWKGIDYQGASSSKQQFFLQNAFAEYWEKGGFPEARSLSPELRVKVHQEYFHAILFRDLVERHDISHPKAVSDLAYWLADNIASPYSINKLWKYLKSLGHSVSKEDVSSYLGWFEDSYFFFSVRIFDASLRKSHANPKKAYCIDHALIPSVSSGVLVNSGHLLENLVFVALRHISPNIFYYRTKNDHEVDFVVQSRTKKRLLVQVCESLVDEAVKKREVVALEEAMEELQLQSSVIVTRNEGGMVKIGSKTISLVPAWQFLVGLCSNTSPFAQS